MLVIIVTALLFTTTHAQSPRAALDYLNPNLYQEHVQSPKSHYKYSYQSNPARAQQVQGSDDKSRGFYSYINDPGKMQHVDYVAGQNGFNIVGKNRINGSPILPSYTPEVEAARKIHLESYLEAQRRVFAEQRTVNSETIMKQIETPSTNNIPLEYESNHIHSRHTTFDDNRVNLFSGQPLGSSYQNNYNVYSSKSFFQTTTSRPTSEYTATNMENKGFILPTPTVHHYEKIWPLPAIRYRDLEIRVNGQDWYDPRTANPNRNVVSTPEYTEAPQGVQQTTFQSLQFQNPTAIEVVPKTNYFLQPNTFSLTSQHSEATNKHQTIFDLQQTSRQSSNSIRPTDTAAVSRTDHLSQPSTSGLTAHQADLINYKQGLPINSNMPYTEFTNQYTNVGVNIMSRGNIENVNRPITEVKVTQSHVDVKNDISALALQKAFNIIKGKYN